MGRAGSGGMFGGGANIFPAEFNSSSAGGPGTSSVGPNNRAKSAGDLFPTDDLLPGASNGLAGATTTTGAQGGTAAMNGTHQVRAKSLSSSFMTLYVLKNVNLLLVCLFVFAVGQSAQQSQHRQERVRAAADPKHDSG